MAEEPHQQPETDVRESDPNASGPQGLTGDMGISSERTGPEGSAPADTGVQSTGTHGTAAEGTYGVSNTERDDDLAAAEEATEPDDPMAHATAVSDWREQRHAERRSADDADGKFSTGIDRTAGESNPAEVPPQEFDRTKNPGHSHGS